MASIADVYVTVLPETSKISDGIKRALLAADKDVRAAASRWKKEIEAELQGVEAKVDLKVDDKDIKRKLDALENTKVTITAKLDVDSDAGAAESKLDAVARDRKAKIVAEADEASAVAAGKKISANLRKASGTGKGFTSESGGVNLPFRATIPFPVAIEAVGITPTIVPLIGSMVRSVGELTGALGLMPAVVGSVGLAFGSLKIATLGFGDALKEIGDPEKFAEAISQLSPAARQAATAIQGLMPQIGQLRATVQDALFTGVGPELTKLGSTYLPIFQDIMSRMAQSAGTAFKGISKQLQTPEMQSDIKTFGANASQAFTVLLRAARPLVKAFTDIATVGSSFLPQLAGTVSDLATRFSKFIGNARESGKLAGWISDGITAFTQLKDIAVNVWNIFKGIFDAAGGGDFLKTVRDLTTTWSNWVNSIEGQDALKKFFDEAKQTLKDIWPIIRDLGKSLYVAFLGAKDTIDEILPLVRNIAEWMAKNEGLIYACGVAFASWKLASIVQDIVKIGTALMGLSATAGAAGTATGGAFRTGLMSALGIGGMLGTLTIGLAVAGGALAIWAGERLLAGGNTIQLPVGDVGVPGIGNEPGPGAVSNPNPNDMTPSQIAARNAGTPNAFIGGAGAGANQRPLGALNDRNAPGGGPNIQPPPAPAPGPAPPTISAPPPLPTGGGGGGGGAGGAEPPKPVAPPGMSFTYGGYGELNWEALAQAESGGNWAMNNGNGFYGGLQFDQATWVSHGGPPGTTADQFSKQEQIDVATALFNERGIQPWPDNGWLLTATPDQLHSAGLTGSGRQSTSRSRGGGYPGSGGGQPLNIGPGGIPTVAPGTHFGAAGSQQPARATAGAISQLFPGVREIGGQRPDSMPYHREGRAIDVMIPNYNTPEGKALGDQIKQWAMDNAQALGVEDTIWQDFWQPTGGGAGHRLGRSGATAGHYDHVHITFKEGATANTGQLNNTNGQYTYDGPGTNAQNPMYTTSKDTGGEQLGKDIVTGILDVFGFGDIFKSPLDFGAFKMFKGAMGMMFGGGQYGDTGSGYGSGGGGYGGGGAGGFISNLLTGFGGLQSGSPGTAPGEFIPPMGSGGGSGAGGLIDFASGLIPGAEGQGGMNNSGNFNVQVNAANANARDLGPILDGYKAPWVRQGLRNNPAPAG